MDAGVRANGVPAFSAPSPLDSQVNVLIITLHVLAAFARNVNAAGNQHVMATMDAEG